MTEMLAKTGAVELLRCAKLQSNRYPSTNQQSAFYRPDPFPVAQPTVSKQVKTHQFVQIKRVNIWQDHS